MRRSPSKLLAPPTLGLLLLGAGIALWGHRSGASGSANAGVPPERAPSSSQAYPRPGPGLNLLAKEASPYLQLHAHNPVDWYPWGEQAFARARAEEKLVFLSVGYSTCYWCHVMERQVFSNPEIASFMNAHYISIKVDREERPDIDDIYMKATQILTRSGGWPNSVFLTPEGKPFFAGTYFPPEDGYGRPGFPRVLRQVYETWMSERGKVLIRAEEITRRIRSMAAAEASPGDPPPAESIMEEALAQLRSDYDAVHGGFGQRTKFPRPPSLGLLLARLARGENAETQEMLVRTLDAMALGGIYDHLGDGFHRYTTEPTWSIPHFEKMLYDNAQLVSVYARAYALTGRPLYRRVVERTLAYLQREMSHPDGGFFSAQDAEVAGEEGASYVWSRDEIQTLLGPERARQLLSVYQLTPLPEHAAFGVLRVQLPLSELLVRTGATTAAELLERFDDARATLLAERAKRPQPLRDDKVLAAWNGLAIRALVDAAQALHRPDYLRRAERAAQFVLGRLLREDGSLHRSFVAGQPREAGVLDDYAFLSDGLLALHEATDDPRWLDATQRLVGVMLTRFQDHRPDGSAAGFFLTPDGSKLLVRPKPFEDNALPAGNGVGLHVLRRLAALAGTAPEGATATAGREDYAAAARGTAAAASRLLQRAPWAVPTVVVALLDTPDPTEASPAVPRAAPTERTAPSRPFRLPRSEDHVHPQILGTAEDDGASLRIRMTIDPGWHVNAHPASFPYLIATRVEDLAGNEISGVTYPAAQSFRPAFATEPLRVYEGTIEFTVPRVSGANAPSGLALRYQACDAERCLPPHREVLLPTPGARDATIP